MDKDKLLAPRADTPSGMPEDFVDVPGLGTVCVRGLSRFEVLDVRKATDDAQGVDGPRALMLERKMVSLAMLDPVLTEAEVGTWQKIAGAAELNVVSLKIQELSGMTDAAPKEAYKSLRDESGS